MVKISTMTKRFFENSPFIFVSIALLAVGLAAPFVGLAYPQIAAFDIIIVMLGLMVTYQIFKKRSNSAIVTPFRTWLRDYQRLITVNEQYGPMPLMRRLMSHPSRDKTKKAVWSVLSERTTVLHEVLVDDLQTYVKSYDQLGEADLSSIDIKDFVKSWTEDLWRIIDRYHTDVIGILLQMKQENPPKDANIRDDFSKFGMFYNEVLKQMKSACERANAELSIDLRTEIEKLLIPNVG